MKSNPGERRPQRSAFVRRVGWFFKWLWATLSNNLGYKLLSLLLAILLWSYVISTNTSITRPKTLHNLTGYLYGQTTLAEHKLALPEDPSPMLSGITVTVEAPQADYSRVSSDNVQVMLDLSNVRNAGTQEVPLRATSSYGRVRAIVPESVTLNVETLDSRNVYVNAVTARESDGYWYSITRINPSMFSVSGASSVVQGIASARATVNVSGMTHSTVTAVPYVLLNAAGEEVPQAMLNCSTSSVSVSLDIYPRREIPISTDIASVVTGTPAEGYVLQSVTIQPQSVQVAAEEDLLDSLTELKIDPVSIEGATQSFSATASVSQLSDFKNISSEQVYVNVNIGEEVLNNVYMDNAKVIFANKGDNLVASYDPVGVFVTGPRSAVEALMETGVTLTVDLNGYAQGYYLLDPQVDAQLYPNLSFQCEAVSVTLTDISPEAQTDDQ